MKEELRLGVAGVGRFGRLHAEKMAGLEGARLVAVADLDGARAAAVATALGADSASDHRALIGRVDAVSVAVPAAAHYAVTKDFLEAGIHVLVEKPLTDSVATAREIATLANTRSLVLQVGHIERFSEAFRVVAPRVVRPLYIESIRLAPFSPRGNDVSVVFDVMIHDIDLVLALARAPVTKVAAVGTPVFSGSDDIANARLEFADGCVAAVTASRISLKTERKLRIFQSDAYIRIDHGDRSVRTVRKKGLDSARTDDIGALAVEEEHYEKGDALKREIETFAHAVRTGTSPPVTAADGVRSLEVAQCIAERARAARNAVSSS